MLVAEGAALEVGDVDGRTPLHHAAAHDQMELAKFLLERGADPHAADAWGKKPYQLAAGAMVKTYGSRFTLILAY